MNNGAADKDGGATGAETRMRISSAKGNFKAYYKTLSTENYINVSFCFVFHKECERYLRAIKLKIDAHFNHFISLFQFRYYCSFYYFMLLILIIFSFLLINYVNFESILGMTKCMRK